MEFPIFEHLYVVSDLHLGGQTGFQVFTQQETLAAFINALTKPGDRRIALVLNGDVVDFLAEEPFRYLDPEGAIEKLQRICEAKEFVKVWEALKAFVGVPGRQLVINLGNHDVELALPNVRNWLTNMLSGGDDATRGRITMAVDGAGYACVVGKKQVLCIHGNEDAWNIVDFKELLDVNRAINRGEKPPDWDANAGTRLVIDVMNKIKKKYPFIDMLKPEMDAVVPIILALEPKYLADLHRLVSVAGHGVWDWVRLKTGFLSMEEQATKEGTVEQGALLKLLGDYYGDHLDAGGTSDVETLLAEAHGRIIHNIDPKDYSGEMSGETLGGLSSMFKWLKPNKKKALREALRKKLKDDHSYELKHKDDLFKNIDAMVSRKVDYVIAGHTHLARAIERRYPSRYYYNGGTWISTIELKEEQLDNQEEFEKEVYDKLDAASLDKLKGLILLRPHVVSVIEENGSVHGQLSLAQGNGSLKPVKNTRFPEG